MQEVFVKTMMIMLILGAFPFLSQAEGLHEAVVGKVSSDHASEMKRGDFTSHRTTQRAQSGASKARDSKKTSGEVASTSGKTRKLAHAGAMAHPRKEGKRKK